MGWFGKQRTAAGTAGTDLANRLSGRLDLLQAVTALGALVSAADGDVEASEIEKLGRLIRANAQINSAYTGAQIDKALADARTKVDLGRSGKAALWKEVGDLKGDPDAATVLYLAIDVAEADGEIEGAEQAVLKKACELLGLNLQDLMDGSI